MRQTSLLIATLLTALACSGAHAQWKWRDANGRVTLSDLAPPSTVREADILSRPAGSRPAANSAAPAAATSAVVTSAAPTPKSSSDPELDARRKRAADEQAAQQRQLEERNAAARADNCSRARSYLDALSEGKRVSRPNAQGELELIDDKARADEVQRARTMIASDCK
jgi:Domain of unknown function (DUF4124)